jgi:preprotein translocase subunit SecF
MNWLRYKKIYFLISLVAIIACVFSLLKWGLKLGVEFKGGTIVEYQYDSEISTDEITSKLEENGIGVTSIEAIGGNKYLFKLAPIKQGEKEKLTEIIEENAQGAGFYELKYEMVGPTIGPELVKKTIYAVLIAAGSILIYVAYQFKNFKYGVSAILAMFHDSFILVGSFSLMGHFLGAEVDFLFVTAVLTTLSFSVHDTIVVFDRIREIGGKTATDLEDVANQALTETMVRSLNNSFTIIFMLVALLLLGGTTIKWFAVALLIGTILGTYSSPFVAVPILVSWGDIFSKIQLFKKKS